MLDYDKEKEKKAFKQMTWKEKLDHIWEYYRIPIITAIIILLALGSLINTWFINPPTKPSVQIMIIAPATHPEKMEEFRTQINKDLPQYKTDKEEILFLTTGSAEVANPQYVAAEQQRFTALLAARDLDIIMGDMEYLQAYAERGTFMDLKEFFTEEEFQSLPFPVIEGRIRERDYGGEILSEEDPLPYFIDISDVESLRQFILSDNIGIGIAVNSMRLEESKDVVNYLLNFK